MTATNRIRTAGLTLILTALFGASAQSQDYQITTSTFGGGGSSAGGGFSLTGTVEQTTGNDLAGGDFSLQSGFLAGVVVQQTPGAPRIIVTRNGADIILTWTTVETGWVLESSAAVNISTATWAAASEPVAQTDDMRTVTLNAPTGIRFYRLKKTTAN